MAQRKTLDIFKIVEEDDIDFLNKTLESYPALLSQLRNYTTYDGDTFLLLAVENNAIKISTLLLSIGFNPNEANAKDKETPLTLAAQKGHKDIVILLLNHQADHTHKAKNGCDAVFYAIQNGHYSIAKHLIFSYGATTKTTTPNGTTTLWMTAQNRNKQKKSEEMAKILIELDVPVNAPENDNQTTPLWNAAAHGEDAVLALLISAQADIEKCDKTTNSSPLWMAASGGHTNCLRQLLDAGAKVDHQDMYLMTPLVIALAKNHTECANALIATCSVIMPLDQLLNSKKLTLIIKEVNIYSKLEALVLQHISASNLINFYLGSYKSRSSEFANQVSQLLKDNQVKSKSPTLANQQFFARTTHTPQKLTNSGMTI